MDLFDVARACFRRFYVVVPLLVVAAWFAHDEYSAVKPVYYSNAVFALVQPSKQVPVVLPGQEIQRNGFVDSGGPGLLTNMVTLGLSNPSVMSQVVAAGGQPNYRVKVFPTPPTSPPLPMVMIEAIEPDPESGPKTVDLVLAQADPILRAVQQEAGVPEEQFVKSIVVQPPSPPFAGTPNRTRSTLAILAAGVALAVLAGVVVDVLILRWKARRQRRRAAAVPALTETPAVPVTGPGPRHERITERNVMVHGP